MNTTFNNRVFGCVIIKSINSNYNADFSHQPRTLPDGVVYATDKTLKYSVRNYFKNALGEKIFYFKSLNDEMAPRSLDETYEKLFGKFTESDSKKVRQKVLKDLLTVIDVRLFGGTYAGKTNISIHGPCQITHGINKYPENLIYSEQIMSPFRNSKGKDETTMTTLGTQSKLREGHYVHHFSLNPHNIEDDINRVNGDFLQKIEIDKLKEALRKGVSFYDSSSKIGTENELLVWVQLNENSKIILPAFTELIDINLDRSIDLSKLNMLLSKSNISSEIEKIELYYNIDNTTLINVPSIASIFDLEGKS